MSLLVFQITIKQWDKGQTTPAHFVERAAIPTRHVIAAQPNFYLLDKPCILEQFGSDIPTDQYQDGRVKTLVLPSSQVQFDRFLITPDPNGDVLAYLVKGKVYKTLGVLNDGWIQCCYSWRYGVKEGGMFYWMYEEVTLNASRQENFDAEYFLKSEPGSCFTD